MVVSTNNLNHRRDNGCHWYFCKIIHKIISLPFFSGTQRPKRAIQIIIINSIKYTHCKLATFFISHETIRINILVPI